MLFNHKSTPILMCVCVCVCSNGIYIEFDFI